MYKSCINQCAILEKSQTTKMTWHISPRFGEVSIVKVFVGSNFRSGCASSGCATMAAY